VEVRYRLAREAGSVSGSPSTAADTKKKELVGKL
jgi:hypothetical protein